MKKGKELEEIINENLPKLFKKYFLPKIDEKRLEDKLNEIKPKLDSEIENLLKKYPTEGKKAMSISSRMFFGHIDFWMHKDNPDAFWKDENENRLLKGEYEQEAKDYALKLFSHHFYDRIHEEAKISIAMFLCGMLDHPFEPNPIPHVNKYALTDDVILIQGETGTGKELLAKTIHYLSNRRTKSFIPINSGGLNDETLLSELFGHKKGAFTGAVTDKKGAFELAKEGTLFLDEVGDMCPKAQVSLLRVLNDRKIQRLGETGKDIYVDVRVIAATNKNLRKEISERNFREDLFYRLNVIPINLPSIRKYSKEKIESIIWKTLAKIARDIQPEDIVKTTSGKDLYVIPQLRKLLSISEGALAVLINYNYPGNYRELENILKNAFIMTGKKIELEHLREEVRNYGIQANSDIPNDNMWLNYPYKEFKDKMDSLHKRKLEATLQVNNWNVSKTAREIGIAGYKLQSLMRQIGIVRQK